MVSLENDIIVPFLLAPFCENSYPIIYQPCIALILKICLFEFSGKRHFSKHGYFAIFSPKQQQRLVAWQRHWIFTKKDKPEKLTDFTAFIYVTTLYEWGCWHKLSTKKAYICIRHTTWWEAQAFFCPQKRRSIPLLPLDFLYDAWLQLHTRVT